jgi:tRNA-specific 2-thiouridylase
MKPLAAIAISGGIDSLVAAHLLKQAGHPLLGLHFITGFETWMPPSHEAAPSARLREAAQTRMATFAAQLDLSVEVVDLRGAFQRVVVDYFTAAYARGRTPNPCLACNPGIKFGDLLTHARRRGADFLATGHYARIVRTDQGPPRLFKGIDAAKDQSYFLARLTTDQLALARFPLGEQTKAQTRAIAAEAGLKPLADKESQDICFIQKGAYRDFLSRQPGFCSAPGPVVNAAGEHLGTHEGLHRYTVGQRRGIGIPGPQPYYVVRLEPQTNRLVVGLKAELYGRFCRVTEINWIAPPPRFPLEVMVRIRYRHEAVPARLVPAGEDGAGLFFTSPQKAVTPGQGAVFYLGEEVLGGGWICDPEAPSGDDHDVNP